MKKKVLFLLFVLFLVFSQCAYYNTFFYAKHYYKKANVETKRNLTGKLSNNEKQNYQKAIEKANRLIVLYPNSKYVDDALLMLGKSHYYRSEYPQARRRLNYLLTRVPDSEHVSRGQLWLAKVDIGQERFESAETTLNELIESRPDRDIQGQANFYLAKIHEENEDFESAIVFYKNAYRADVKEIKTDALFAIGADYDSLGAYDLAAEYFLKAMKSTSDFHIRTEAQYRYAISLKKMGEVDEAISIFEELQVDERNKKKIPNYRLRIAESLVLRNDIDGAIRTFQDITEDFKRKKYSAEAYYSLGKLFENYKNEYEKAVENYAKVRSEYQRSVFVDSAETRKRDIQRMTALKQVIRMAITGEEGDVVEVIDETEDLAYQDSLYDSYQEDNYSAGQDTTQQAFDQQFQENNEMNNENDLYGEQGNQIQDNELPDYYNSDDRRNQNRENDYRNNQDLEKPVIVENPELKTFKKEELDKNLLLLGELYLLRFSLLDSAASQYRMLIDQFPESPYAPQAHYNLCHVYSEVNESEKSKSCYHELLENYPTSPYANDVRQKLNLPLRLTQEDTVQSLFESAEKVLFDDNDPKAAFQKYQEIVEVYPTSSLAPKAAYTLGWIAETRFDSLELAYVLYDSLAAHYPESEQARNALKKVQAVKAHYAEEDRMKQAKADSLNKPIQIKQPVRHDSLETVTDTTQLVNQNNLPSDSSNAIIENKTVSLESETMPEAEPENGLEALQIRIKQVAAANKLPLHGFFQCEVLVDTSGSVKDIIITQGSNPNIEGVLVNLIEETKFIWNEEKDQLDSRWELLTLPFEVE